jgi:hypothetical protein
MLNGRDRLITVGSYPSIFHVNIQVLKEHHMKSSRLERYDYRLRIQVPADSPEALLLKYLKHDGNRVFSHREMVITAITAYWLVFAYRDAHQLGLVVSDTDMQGVVRDSIYRLNHQASYLHTFLMGKYPRQTQANNGQKLLPHQSPDFPDSGYQTHSRTDGFILDPYQL